VSNSHRRAEAQPTTGFSHSTRVKTLYGTGTDELLIEELIGSMLQLACQRWRSSSVSGSASGSRRKASIQWCNWRKKPVRWHPRS
jgi:hypothetical protein